MAVYLGLSPVPHGLFAIVGHGLRLAQDMGAHRRATYGATPNAEDELKKRAFWYVQRQQSPRNVLNQDSAAQVPRPF